MPIKSYEKRNMVTTPAPIYYVSPLGNDAADGLSWATAKRTVLAAYDAAVPGSRIIIASDSIIGGEVNGQGLWIMGSRDAAYANPPPGWRRYKSVEFFGANETYQAQFTQGASTLKPNTTDGHWLNDITKPCIWLSGLSQMRLSNLVFVDCVQLARIGVGSDGQRVNSFTTNIYFSNVNGILRTVDSADSGQAGPAIDSGYSFWIDWRESFISAYARASVNTDRRAGILLGNGSESAGPGLWTVDKVIFAAGGIRSHSNGGHSSFTNLTLEGGGVLADSTARFIGGTGGSILLQNILQADAIEGSEPNIVIGNGSPPSGVVCINCDGVVGPAIILGRSNTGDIAKTGASGSLIDNSLHYIGNTKIARGLGAVGTTRFSPVSLAGYPPISAGAWTVTSVPGPIGLPAYQLSVTKDANWNIGSKGALASVGDIFVFGGWFRAPSGVDPSGGSQVFLSSGGVRKYTTPGIGLDNAQISTSLFTTTWKFIALAATVSTDAGTPSTTYFNVGVFPNKPVQMFQPFLYYIPINAGYSEADIRDWVYNMAAMPSGCTPGNAVLLPGQNLEFGVNAGANGGRQLGTASAIPTSGIYERGSIFWNSAPAIGQPKGWMCTSAGNPGTWVSMGNL